MAPHQGLVSLVPKLGASFNRHIVSLSQRQLVMVTYKFLHHVCHRITCSHAFNANNLYLKGFEQGSPLLPVFRVPRHVLYQA